MATLLAANPPSRFSVVSAPPIRMNSTAGLFFCGFPASPPGAPLDDLARCGALEEDEHAGGGSQLPLLAMPSNLAPLGELAGLFVAVPLAGARRSRTLETNPLSDGGGSMLRARSRLRHSSVLR